jgi:hypothetical protein
MDTQAVAGYAASWRTEGTSGEKTMSKALPGRTSGGGLLHLHAHVKKC